MKEKELVNSISNFYSKFFDSSKEIYPQCQCGNEIRMKIIKIGLNLIDLGICNKCNRISFFKEIREYSQGKYQQVWKKRPISEIKFEFEKQLDSTINDNDLLYYSSNLDILISKLENLELQRVKKAV